MYLNCIAERPGAEVWPASMVNEPFALVYVTDEKSADTDGRSPTLMSWKWNTPPTCSKSKLSLVWPAISEVWKRTCASPERFRLSNCRKPDRWLKPLLGGATFAFWLPSPVLTVIAVAVEPSASLMMKPLLVGMIESVCAVVVLVLEF